MLATSTSRSSGIGVEQADAAGALERGVLEEAAEAGTGDQRAAEQGLRHRQLAPAHRQVRRDQAVPAVDEVELHRGPVLPVPGCAGQHRRQPRIQGEAEVVGGDVVDVLLDDQLDQQHDEDVARRLEQALVVPARVVRGRAARATLLCSRRNSTVSMVKPSWMLPRSLPVANSVSRCASVSSSKRMTLQRVELRLDLAVLAQVGRELPAVDEPALQQPAVERAQRRRRRRVEAVELVRSMWWLELFLRGSRGTCGVAAQETVGEPLGEVGEQHRGARAGDHGLAAGEQVGGALGRGPAALGAGDRGQVPAAVGAVGQRGPRGVAGHRAQRLGPRRHLADRVVDQRRR